ncbi:MAG: methyltransferase domain-containing protein [Candidatus Eremiobacteraeota bacterium]|nr:methyltransferase domain-containing protein [Candidatus Eremiobacteraeota bacterium]
MAGLEQTWDAAGYARHGRFVAELATGLVELLEPRAGERILDLGCGDGAFTRMVAESQANVLGIDSSPALVAAARAAGVRAELGDARALCFSRAFDAVVSNAALHWMGAPDAVLAGVAAALRPGGRFAGEFGGKGNVAAVVTALVAALDRRGVDGRAAIPWYFPTAAEYRARLEAHGFRVVTIALVPRPTPLATGLDAWLETFAAPFFARLPEGERLPARREVIALLAPSLQDDAGAWTADYVRLRFLAVLDDAAEISA